MIFLPAAMGFKHCYAQHRADTISIYFNVGDATLTATSKHVIDSLMYNDVLAPGRKVGLIGYADNLGSEIMNKTLSAQRAASVQQYLLSMNMDSSEIESVTAAGEINRAENTSGYPQDRKVAIVPGGFRKTNPVKAQKKLGDIIHYVKDTPVIDVDQIDVNSVFKLDKVYFRLGSTALLKESIPMLTALYNLMHDHDGVKIRVEGHVCCSAPYNIVDNKKVFIPEGKSDTTAFTNYGDLSVDRAYSVYWFLVKKGINNNRIQCVGYGTKRRLVVPEVTDEDKAANRRVEIRIIAK